MTVSKTEEKFAICADERVKTQNDLFAAFISSCFVRESCTHSPYQPLLLAINTCY